VASGGATRGAGSGSGGKMTRSEAGRMGAAVSNQNSRAQSERAMGNNNRSKNR
jgi:hypothetical protein